MERLTYSVNWSLAILVVALYGGVCVGLECEYFNITECPSPDAPCPSRRNMTCTSEDPSSHRTSCFVLWQRGATPDLPEILKFKGCFINNRDCKDVESCVDRNHGSHKPSKNSSLHTHYCCCDTDLCNRDYAWQPTPTLPPVKQPIIERERDVGVRRWVWISSIVAVFCIMCVILGFLVYRLVGQKPLPTSTSNLTDEENILLDKSESHHALSPVELIEQKATGRFGSVWKASMAGTPDWVAVKILPLREKTSWRLEQEVYSLPLMCDSQLILGYFGARTDPDSMQLWLISEYITDGSLYDYMKGHELSWSEVLKIALTMCQGLSFLHDEIDAGIKGVKPAVAHRDFKSKNVLLRPDLTACIADFGLAHIFYPSKLVGTNHGQVGTRRYMAPEVLDGAVSFTRDNFQRIDMYACGLVLWELASRCSAQQGPVGEYRLPFEEHVGQQPTLEEMIECVVTQRKRPTLRNDWSSHPGLAVMAEAVKEAWDQDAEARISASCIVERLHSVSNKII